jgi:RND family efflux transporter MFP subunit
VIRKYLLPLLAIIGLIFAIWMVKQASKPVLPARPVADPPRVSFENKISGVGIVEASTRNIAIGSHVSGIVQRVQVRVAQKIKAGDPLFTLDGRAKKADLAIREARVLEESANLKDLEAQMKVAEKVKDPRAISADDLNKRRFAVQVAEARLANAVAQVEAARIEIDLLTVRSPIDGEVLQVNIRPGEYAPTGTTEVPLILIGNLDRLHVRVDVDENDAWRFQPGAPAVAYVRGNPEMKTDLRFEYIEKYVVPKRSLTGESTERVDTRVMQVVYSFDRRNLSVFPGQLLDVFIDAPIAELQEPGEGKKKHSE